MHKMTRKECELFKHYRREDNGNYVIDVQVPNLQTLFNTYDPSPLHEKDINQDIMEMILDQCIVFPDDVNVELHIHLPKKLMKKKLEAGIEQAIRHHFEYELLDSELHLERRLRKGIKTFKSALVIFLTLLSLSYILDNSGSDFVFFHLLSGGFEVGAWVSMWHPIEMLLYDWLPLYEDKKKYARLRDMRFKFKYV